MATALGAMSVADLRARAAELEDCISELQARRAAIRERVALSVIGAEPLDALDAVPLRCERADIEQALDDTVAALVLVREQIERAKR